MYESKIWCEIWKGTFEISHKILNHTPQNMHITLIKYCVWVTKSLNCDVISLSETVLYIKITNGTAFHKLDKLPSITNKARLTVKWSQSVDHWSAFNHFTLRIIFPCIKLLTIPPSSFLCDYFVIKNKTWFSFWNNSLALNAIQRTAYSELIQTYPPISHMHSRRNYHHPKH